jgi:hypothetical protein
MEKHYFQRNFHIRNTRITIEITQHIDEFRNMLRFMKQSLLERQASEFQQEMLKQTFIHRIL